MRKLLTAVPLMVTLAGSAADAPPPIGGYGSHPLSGSLSAAWLLKTGFSARKLLPFIVYFAGSPGWVHEKTVLDIHVGKDPSHFRMLVGPVPVDFTYTDSDGIVQLYGVKVLTTLDNVILVSDITSGTPRVEKLGYAALTFESGDNPAVTLLERDPRIRKRVMPE